MPVTFCKARMRLAIVTYILSFTVSEVCRIIGEIYAVDMLVSVFNALFLGRTPKFWMAQYGFEKPDNIPLSYEVKCISITRTVYV